MSSEAAAVRALLRLSSGCAFLSAVIASAPATALPFRPRHSPRAQTYVYIKRTGGGAGLDPNEVFAPLSIDGIASVGLLAKRACAEFLRWGADAGKVRLYLVAHAPEADEPPSADEEARAEELTRPHWTLVRAGVVSGSWLLARVPPPAGASCGEIHSHPPILLPYYSPTLLFPTRSTPSQMHPRACRGEPPPMRCPRRRPSARLLSTRRARRWAPSSARFVLGRRMCRACSRAR